jgi:membrane associated rhomboid family serine protease
MIIPLRTDSRLYSTPYMNWVLIGVNVLVFIAQQTVWGGDRAPGALDPRHLQLINYFTYQFLHASPIHVGGNMLFLYIFGNNVNDRMGNWGYLAFYLAGGVASGIGFVLTSNAPVIGASGAIAAVTGAYLVLLPRSHITLVYFIILIGMIEIPSIWFIALNFAWDFIGIGEGGNVAHTAHLAGYAFGASTSFLLLWLGMLPRDQFDMFALFQRWNRRRQYQDMVKQGFDPFGHITPSAQRQAVDPRIERIQDIRAQISEALAHHKVEEAARFYLELHAIEPQQVLAKQNQLDVANQLFAQEVYGAAADAYEAFIRAYPKYEQMEQIQLVLGLLYARYLNRADRAREHLGAALSKLQNPKQIELARDELAKIGGSVAR